MHSTMCMQNNAGTKASHRHRHHRRGDGIARTEEHRNRKKERRVEATTSPAGCPGRGAKDGDENDEETSPTTSSCITAGNGYEAARNANHKAERHVQYANGQRRRRKSRQ